VSWSSFEEASDALWVLSQGFGPHTRAQWLDLCRPQLRQNEQGRWISRYDPAIGLAFKALTPEIARAGEGALWAAYDRITAPTLVLRGADSDLLTAQTAGEMALRGPCATVVEFAGVGHAPTLVAQDQIACVQQFLLAD
jgi:pimeloyl-ACP methyl ester carboxylesterase